MSKLTVMTQIDPSTALGALATRLPAASRVFMRHHLDFCCSGARSLREACQEAGLDVGQVIVELRNEQPPIDTRDWTHAAPAELIEHIVRSYHEPHREELPRLRSMAERVFDVHRERDPDRLGRIAELTRDLEAELVQHMAKEEQILFPWIVARRRPAPRMPIVVMIKEHDDAGRLLHELRNLTDDFTPPAGACATWRALWLGLAEFSTQLQQHIHLENNVLFPAVLGGADPA